MRLFKVMHRRDLRRGDRHVYVHRTIVLAANEDEAIAVAKGHDSWPEEGSWWADQLDDYCGGDLYTTEASAEDKAKRAARK